MVTYGDVTWIVQRERREGVEVFAGTGLTAAAAHLLCSNQDRVHRPWPLGAALALTKEGLRIVRCICKCAAYSCTLHARCTRTHMYGGDGTCTAWGTHARARTCTLTDRQAGRQKDARPNACSRRGSSYNCYYCC